MKELEKIVDSNGEPLEIVDAEARADISELKQSLSDFETLEKTASGAIATFDDGSDLPMPSLKVAIEPQQEGSGEPSPTNIRPISGWDEVNVVVSPLNIASLYNGQIYGDGSWVENNARLTNAQTTQSNTYFLKAGTYTLDYDKLNPNAPSLYECSVLTKDENYNIIDNFANAWQSLPFTFTLTQDAYLYFTMRYGAVTNVNPSDYKAKILGHTYTIDLDGTRYGGTLDVVSGVLTVDRASVDLGTVNWDKYTNSAKTYFRTSAQLPDAKKSEGGLTTHNLMCSNYKEDSWSHVIDSSGYDGNICIGWNNNAYIGIYDSRYVDVSATDFKTAMNGVQLVYELATPLTIQLTPTQVKSLRGVNNIWANTGDLELTYFVNNSLVYAIYDMINILTS